jgi:hypothetical protein
VHVCKIRPDCKISSNVAYATPLSPNTPMTADCHFLTLRDMSQTACLMFADSVTKSATRSFATTGIQFWINQSVLSQMIYSPENDRIVLIVSSSLSPSTSARAASRRRRAQSAASSRFSISFIPARTFSNLLIPRLWVSL